MEIFRIRVENATGGRVQVSMNGGKNYTTVGHVRHRATTTLKGFAASIYTPNSAVTATAVHAIRIRTGLQAGEPMTVSIVSSEFATVPADFGGYIPLDSGIYTDIPTGTAIFRNFAPFVGNPAKIERGNTLLDIPEGWQPTARDVIVIIATLPKPYLKEVVFENCIGGDITATYDNGRPTKIGTVIEPVAGIGRFDATSYTGEGLINTNHGGVLTISTAPVANTSVLEGRGEEHRGGFQIQPAEHWKTQIPMPQSMAVAPLPGAHSFEGQAPLFADYVGLAYDPKNPEHSMRAEVRLPDGAWHKMPGATGKEDAVLKNLGVTSIRLLFPRYDRDFLSKSLAASAVRPRGPSVKGLVKLEPSVSVPQGSLVAFTVDGQVKSVTNQPPYVYFWDTSSYQNGEYEVEISVTDAMGTSISSEKRRMFVWNPG